MASDADRGDTGPGLARRSVTAALWNHAGGAAWAISQFVVAIALARLLGPATFGVVAVGWMVVGLGGLFGDLGFGAAIIQRATITRRDVDFAFTLQLAGSLAVTLAVWVGAPWLARFFDQPDAANVVRAMAASLIIRAFGQTPTALLQRDLRFRATQIIAVASYAIGFGGVGVALAWLGCGAWSLVGAQYAQTIGSSVAALAVTRRRPALATRPTHPDIAATGLMVIAANASSWCLGNVDTVIVGHVAGPVALGLYNRATALATMPAAILINGLQGVLLSAASRIQAEPARVGTAFLGCVALFVLLAGSVLATMALVADTVVSGLLGPAWRGAAPLLSPLALAIAVNGMLAFAGPVLTATGNIAREAQAQWLLLPPVAIVILFAAQHSVAAAAWAVVGCYAIRLAVLYARVKQSLALTWAEPRRALLPPFAIAAATAATTRLADTMLHAVAPPARLAADIAIAGLTLGTAMLLMRGPLSRGPLGEAVRASAIVPPGFRRWLRP